MPCKFSLETEGYIKALIDAGKSYRDVQRILKDKRNIKISLQTIGNIVKNKGKTRDARQHGQVYKRKGNRTVRTPELIKKIERRLAGENPKTIS